MSDMGGNSFLQKCPNFNLGILKTEGGGLYFSKMSELKIALRHHQKKKKKLTFLVFLHANMPVFIKGAHES